MSKNYYLVGKIDTKIMTNIGVNIALSWVDGQVGAMAVFTNKKKALKYAGNKAEITIFEKVG